jgi:hypothetical protein
MNGDAIIPMRKSRPLGQTMSGNMLDACCQFEEKSHVGNDEAFSMFVLEPRCHRALEDDLPGNCMDLLITEAIQANRTVEEVRY